MGKRGPKPTPTDILQVRGAWRARQREGEPTPKTGELDAPACLRGEALAEWERQASLLAAEGRLALIDRAALALYCAAWGEFVEACEQIAELGSTTTTDKGNILQSPWVSIRNKSRDAAIKIGAQFGFTPSARVGLKGTGEPEPETNDRYAVG